ncbi:MAG: TonB-dependent receptor [Caulobacteraceae bacterium]|nr:TonB-dependent receptor [Caulobacteraceae bacterium]
MSNNQSRALRASITQPLFASAGRAPMAAGAHGRALAALLATTSLLVVAGGAHAAEAQAGGAVDEVVVTAAPREEVRARAVQIQAPNLIEVQSAETIAKYPDFNAAEALGRLPGVSLSSDTGEGRFVQIRGIDANLNGATYGGVPLLNTNPGGTYAGGGGRAVEFDTIPTGAIDGVIVTLTGLPDHDAEGLGGSVELSPRTAANIRKPFLDITLGEGYEPLHHQSGPFNAEIAAGARFGFGDKGLIVQKGATSDLPPGAGFISNPTPFSFVFSASTKQDRRAVDDLEASYVDDGMAPSNAISQYDLRRYDYHRVRFGYGGDFEFQPNDDHTYYIRADIAGYTESVKKNFLLYKGMSSVEGPQGQIPTDPNNKNGYLVTTTPTITLTDESETHRNSIYVIGGKDRFGDLDLDYHAAYSRATYDMSQNIGATFSGPKNTPLTYDNVSSATYPAFTLPAGTNLNNASLYKLSALTNGQTYDVDEEYSYAANASFPARFLNDSGHLKIGAQVRLRDKVSTPYKEAYKPQAVSLDAMSGPALSYYNGHYTNGPQINADAVQNLINSGAAGAISPVFNSAGYFTAKEDIYAAYAQYMTEFGKWGLLTGVRVEATNANYGGYVQTNTANTFQTRTNDYVNAFPTVQLRYSFTPDMLLRATYSTGIARPGFRQNSTAATVDLSQSPVLITRGNPALKPTLGNNFDLSLEDYLPNGGIVQFGLFDKEFTNYIAPRIQNGVMDPLAPGQLANVTTYLNIPTAYARGIEAAYHQQFTFLPGPLNGLGVEANATLVDSHMVEYTAAQSLSGQAQSGPLPGTSATTWNLAGFYEAHGLETRIAAQYVGHSLFGLGGDRSLDTIQDDRLTLDFTSSYKVNPTLTVYFNAKNLTNAPLRYYEGSSNRPIQREFYDATYELGVKIHL